MGPRPNYEKQPQNIRLGLCFTVEAMQFSLNSSSDIRQTLPHPEV